MLEEQPARSESVDVRRLGNRIAMSTDNRLQVIDGDQEEFFFACAANGVIAAKNSRNKSPDLIYKGHLSDGAAARFLLPPCASRQPSPSVRLIVPAFVTPGTNQM